MPERTVSGQTYASSMVVSHRMMEQALLDVEAFVLDSMKRNIEEALPPEPRVVIRPPKLEFEDYEDSWQVRRPFFGRVLERLRLLKPLYRTEPMRRYVLTTVVAAL